MKKILALGFVWLLVACSAYSPFDVSEMPGTYHLIALRVRYCRQPSLMSAMMALPNRLPLLLV